MRPVVLSESSRTPSLRLNLGEAYRRLSGHARARAHLDQGRAVAALADDGYGRMI
ncbi:MAG TPA: hypothetical protein VHN80_31250 [Kineosporiaceae bacterium]|nr:hypothetical protein [Kineosporiaceae bacterium]